MPLPTVGRHVHYYPAGRAKADQPQAAIIAHVWSDTCVNIALFDDNGRPVLNPPTSVALVDEGQQIPAGQGFCCWMPYSIEQERKEKQPAESSNQGDGGTS